MSVMRRSYFLILLTLSLLLGIATGLAAQTSLSKPSSDPNDAAKSIEAALHRWTDAYNSQDWPGTLELWAQDALLSFPGQPDRDYQAIRKAALEQTPSLNISKQYRLTLEELVVSGDMAYVRDTWELTTTDRATGQTTSEKFRSMEIWRVQRDETWKITRAMLYPE